MIDRKELKEKGKLAFKANYWKSVIVAFILSLIVGGSASASVSNTTDTATEAANAESAQELSNIFKEKPEVLAVVIGAIVTIVLVSILVATLIDIFVTNPLELGCNTFFLKNSDNPETGLEEIKSGFTPNYGRNVKTLFLRDLKILLWSLLLIVPGIIKAYAYSQVTYILAEDPDIQPADALKKSEEMMMGHKKEGFLLDLSFILWYILSAVTLGLGYIFYVGPWTRATDAEFYKAVKEAQ